MTEPEGTLFLHHHPITGFADERIFLLISHANAFEDGCDIDHTLKRYVAFTCAIGTLAPCCIPQHMVYGKQHNEKREQFMDDTDTLVALTADIVAAHVSNNSVSVADIGGLIGSVHASLAKLTATAEAEPAPPQEPAVSIRASIKPDYLVCLEDGAKVKMLKRYLSTHFGLTPDEYRAKWNLPKDYPMVAPNYAERRRELAMQIGLGKSGRGGRPAKAKG